MPLPFKKPKKGQGRRSPVARPLNRPKPTYYGNDTPRSEDSVRARQLTDQKQTILKRLRLVPTLIALSAILLSVAYSTTLSTVPGIVFVGDATVYRTATEYKSGVGKILGSSFGNKSKLTINTTAVQSEIMKSFPELDVVTVGLPIIGRRPTVTLHVRSPALILTTKTNAFVLDSSGKAVAESNQLISSVTAKLLTAQDQSGLELRVGGQALTSDTMTFISNIAAQLAAKKIVVTGFTLPGGGNEIDVRIKDTAYYIKTDSSGDSRIQIGDFLAARDSGTNPAEYVDVRVEEKVFYK